MEQNTKRAKFEHELFQETQIISKTLFSILDEIKKFHDCMNSGKCISFPENVEGSNVDEVHLFGESDVDEVQLFGQESEEDNVDEVQSIEESEEDNVDEVQLFGQETNNLDEVQLFGQESNNLDEVQLFGQESNNLDEVQLFGESDEDKPGFLVFSKTDTQKKVLWVEKTITTNNWNTTNNQNTTNNWNTTNNQNTTNNWNTTNNRTTVNNSTAPTSKYSFVISKKKYIELADDVEFVKAVKYPDHLKKIQWSTRFHYRGVQYVIMRGYLATWVRSHMRKNSRVRGFYRNLARLVNYDLNYNSDRRSEKDRICDSIYK